MRRLFCTLESEVNEKLLKNVKKEVSMLGLVNISQTCNEIVAIQYCKKNRTSGEDDDND